MKTYLVKKDINKPNSEDNWIMTTSSSLNVGKKRRKHGRTKGCVLCIVFVQRQSVRCFPMMALCPASMCTAVRM